MKWHDIIKNAELVYASVSNDTGLRTWSLKKTTCNISFYEEFQIEDIDKIACSILNSNNYSLDEKRFATVLGFNVVNNFEVVPKRYADSAELDVFRAIIQPVIDWGLIIKSADCYTLSELGEKAFIEEKKYRFYTGNKTLLENPNFKPIDSLDNLFFPFNEALGVYSEITNIKKIEYEKIKLEEAFSAVQTALISRHKLQSKEEYFIFQSEETPYFKFESCQVNIRLYKQDGKYIPIVFYNDIVSTQATELLHKGGNEAQKEKKIEWALYLKLIKDPDAKLDYQAIIPFEDLLEISSLIGDKRLVWSDSKLFIFLAQNSNADQWYTISNNCPIAILKLNLSKYAEQLDWTSLSLRMDNDFLIENPTRYPWNFEAISAKEDISIEVIKTLLLLPELKEEEWDWNAIMPQLDFEFIKSNIDKVNFELGDITKTNTPVVKKLISQYPSKKWDWTYISNEFDLSYILEYMTRFSKYLNLLNTLNRAFTSKSHVLSFCSSVDLHTVLTDAKEHKLSSFSPNQYNYVWIENLIDLLENKGYLNWESGNYTLGFECNPYFEWTYDLFSKYHVKITTEKGYNFLSSHISNTLLVSDYSHFNWNWDFVSTNTNLINDPSFVLKFKDRLNFNLLLPEIRGEILELIFEEANILGFLEDNPDQWSKITEKPSKEFILKNIDYNWDWNILTKRFSSTIKIESLGNDAWIDKWNWGYLTQNLDFNVVLDELDLYVERWDWNYISQEVSKHFILENLPEYNQYWNWQILLDQRLNRDDLKIVKLAEIAACLSTFDNETNTGLWKIITKKLDYEELNSLIAKTYNEEVFNWDYNHFYNLPDFSPLSYLDDNYEIIDWLAFSNSDLLNKSLNWDKNLFSYGVWINMVLKLLKTKNYNWAFKSLSKLDSVNWNSSILKIKTASWDWEYLSEHSNCFKKDNGFTERFYEFINFLDFQSFSKRTDSDITEELLDDLIDKDWNWDTLSCNHSVKFTFTFISKHHNKEWDWEYLSSRNDIEFNTDLFLQLSNKKWNWKEISKRTDIVFSEELIISLHDKPLDWLLVSQNKSFAPNANVLSILKKQELDWKSISINPNLSSEILWDYKDQLDWELITQNKIIKLSDVSFLSKFQNHLDWTYISNSEEFSISLENLNHFKNSLNWSKICERKDFVIYEEHLLSFAEVLNWSKVSMSMNIQFTSELIERYRNKWDWQLLRNNPQVIERLESTLSDYQAEFNCVDFLEQFDREPFIYHFTHLFHAIDIVGNRKILSRNKAKELGLLKYDAAGTVVDRTEKAHQFARFYFRPQTPTQFYNECLGWDSLLTTSYEKSYYSEAKKLGLPKCPMPVFFKFDLKEVLMKMSKKCFHSTGNMQTNRSHVVKIADNPNMLQKNYLFDNISDAFSMAGGPYNYDRQRHISIMEKIKEYSQQEFLVEDEFDFSLLDSFEIICYNEEYANILKSQLGNDPICKKINADGWDLYHRENRKLLISQTESEISIESEYRDGAYLSIKGEGIKDLIILKAEHVQKETKTEIIAYPEIAFLKTEKPIEVYFVDTSEGKRDWLIYKN
jgi:hypothetical protein